MILSIFATVVIALLAMAPGYILMREREPLPGQLSAAMAASLVVSMLLASLVGIAAYAAFEIRLPALTIVAVAVAMITAAKFIEQRKAPEKAHTVRPIFEWEGLALGLVFLAYGLAVQATAVRIASDGALMVHGSFNADWFKHLGHVAAISNYGVPAVDQFNRAEPLHYYWLSYVLPAAGASIGNGVWPALNAANGIYVLLFCSALYGLLRHANASRRVALIAGFLALFITAPLSVLYQSLFGMGLEALMDYPAAPRGAALLTLAKYIPQHMLAITLVMAWFLLKSDRRLVGLSLLALASAMTVSVLLGAIVLLAYGLYRLQEGRSSAIKELVLMVLLSGILVLVFEVVKVGNVDSAIESPLLSNSRPDLPLGDRIAASIRNLALGLGWMFFVSLAGLYFWRPESTTSQQSKRFGAALIVASITFVIAAEILLAERLSIETKIRAVIPPGVGIAIICGGWLQSLVGKGTKSRVSATIAIIVLTCLALPGLYVRTAWHGRIGDSQTTIIPEADLEVLRALKNETPRQTITLQYPEPPVLAFGGGRDAWAAILGQRAVTASLRATDYPSAVDNIESAERFFAAQGEPIAEYVDAVYLSRILHPKTYDALLQRMETEIGFAKVECYADACLFARRAASNQ